MRSLVVSPSAKPIELRRIKYWINWLSRSFASGDWSSSFREQGLDYQGIAPFDDYPGNIINWPATLNSGNPNELQVSIFSPERNITVYLLGDLSASMVFGSDQMKMERLATIAALLSYSAYRLKDYFHFVGFTDEVETGFPRPRGPSYPLRLYEAILRFGWQGKKSGGFLAATGRVSHERVLVIFVSDHFGDLGAIEKGLRRLVPRHDFIPIVLWDRREIEPMSGFGVLPMIDVETGKNGSVLFIGKTRKDQAQNIAERKRQIEELYQRLGLKPHFFTQLEEADVKKLINLFRLRRARL